MSGVVSWVSLPCAGHGSEINEEVGGNFLGVAITVFYALDHRGGLLYKYSSLSVIVWPVN